MGVIQGSINQLLGLGAIASKAIAKEISEKEAPKAPLEPKITKENINKESSEKEAPKAPLEPETPQENINKETEDKETGENDYPLTEYEQKLLKQARARAAAQADLQLEQERLSRSRNFRKNNMEE